MYRIVRSNALFMLYQVRKLRWIKNMIGDLIRKEQKNSNADKQERLKSRTKKRPKENVLK